MSPSFLALLERAQEVCFFTETAKHSALYNLLMPASHLTSRQLEPPSPLLNSNIIIIYAPLMAGEGEKSEMELSLLDGFHLV